MKLKVLTGIKPTGQIHIGNYVGAIQSSLDLVKKPNVSSYFFIADSHSLTSQLEPIFLQDSIYQVSSAWLACGLNPEKSFFYRQSDIPELFELSWILSCVTPKGLMNRAHSYKAKKEENLKIGKKDKDDKIFMGLYSYPILMSADVLLFSPDQVPVGKDQLQHLEMIRDIAGKFNHIYKTQLFKLPKALLKESAVIPGLDGRKMSKSYQNEIPLFLESKKLKILIKKIKTDSLPVKHPKKTEGCSLFQIYKNFAEESELKELKKLYQEGIGWGEVKDILFDKLDSYFKEKKELYDDYISQPDKVNSILKQGAEKVRDEAQSFLMQVKKTVGLLKGL